MIPFSDEELLSPVTVVIDKVRPSIALDGGDIDLISIKNGKVYVQLKGACVGCSSSGTTLKYGVETITHGYTSRTSSCQCTNWNGTRYRKFISEEY